MFFEMTFFLKEVFSSLSLFFVVAVKAKYAETDPTPPFFPVSLLRFSFSRLTFSRSRHRFSPFLPHVFNKSRKN